MARLEVQGPFEGPGEEKTAEALASGLPDHWVIVAGRKLPGANRDDVDLLIVGDNLVFVIEEKAWGPRVVVDDNHWYVGEDARPNPLNRVGQVARKVAGLLRDRAHGYRNIPGQHVVSAVIMSHDRLELFAGRNHDADERIYPLSKSIDELTRLDARHSPGIRPAREAVIALLLDMPVAGPRPTVLNGYRVLGRHEAEGVEVSYEAEAPDGSRVILKCYDQAQLSEYGDPRQFLQRESKALNRLADLSRTWRALPFFVDEVHRLFVVPLAPPLEGRNLLTSVRDVDPARPDGRLDDVTAWGVVSDAFTALAEVHDEGLVHRALHPRRIWLGRRLRVMFSDFHLARISGDETIHPWVRDDASDSYRAPECAADIRMATAASDVYSLALCMLQWLLGDDVTELSLAEIRERTLLAWPWAGSVCDALAGSEQSRPSAQVVADTLALVRPGIPVPSAADLADDATAPGQDVFALEATIDGRYQITQQLGRGGFATTWVAYDTRVNARRVLKEFRRDLPDEAIAEFEAAAALHHHRCARVWDMQVAKAPRYLVCDYIPGSSLAQLEPVPSVDTFRSITLQVCEALSYIHGLGRVHGDVTPGNIIVADGADEATLIDFGLSTSGGGRAAGWHPRFAAPEVVNGLPVSASSDLFGLCASVIHAMLGRYAGRESDGPLGGWVVEPLTEAEARLWGPEGAALLTVLFRAVAGEPTDRHATAGELEELVRSARPAPPIHPHDEAVINPTVLAIRRLYRASSAGNAGNRGLDDDFAKGTYVSTRLDEELLPAVLEGQMSVVLLTGNPGDGKTSFLVTLGDALVASGGVIEHEDAAGWRIRKDGRSYHAVFDASESHGELSSDELVIAALTPVTETAGRDATALIAVNDGRLLQFFRDYDDDFEDLAIEVRRQIAGGTPQDPRVAVVDLKRRSLASLPGQDGLASHVLQVLTSDALWEACNTCKSREACPIVANRALLASEGRGAFEELVLVSHLRRRRRATFRDVRSAAAWLITGDRDCAEIHTLLDAGQAPSLLDDALSYDLAFSPSSSDYLVSEWCDVDPAAIAVPAVDAVRRGAGPDRSGQFAAFGSVESVTRALFFGQWAADGVGRDGLRAYRYFEEFVRMLQGSDPESDLRRILLGMSRIVGAFGFVDEGLAVGSGAPGSDWAVLHLIPASSFNLGTPPLPTRFVESIPDQLVLSHAGGASLTLSLDTAEIILRAADGEIVDDLSSDSIRQEIDGFVTRISRQPSQSARIVDSSGSVFVATVTDALISLES